MVSQSTGKQEISMQCRIPWSSANKMGLRHKTGLQASSLSKKMTAMDPDRTHNCSHTARNRTGPTGRVFLFTFKKIVTKLFHPYNTVQNFLVSYIYLSPHLSLISLHQQQIHKTKEKFKKGSRHLGTERRVWSNI